MIVTKSQSHKVTRFGMFCVVIVELFLFSFTQGIGAEEKIYKEIVIKVKPNIIALPQGEAAKIPLSAARVRSTELRKLNKEYNAVRIEKLFRVKEKAKPKGPTEIKGLKEDLVSKETEVQEETVDLSRLFTKELKKETVAKGKEVVELQDTFLIQFEFDAESDVNIKKLVSAYKALPVVTYADEVIRKK